MKELTIKETLQHSLEALVYLDRFCKDNSIRWWLCGGTLLGAIRHKGFIPWDDDIDIMLPRQEFNRLYMSFPQDGRYRFLTVDNTCDFPYTFGKIVDTTTIKDETIRSRFKRIGIDIDVFPIDNLPSDTKECEKYYKQISKLGHRLDGMTLNYGVGKSFMSTIIKNAFIFLHRAFEFVGLLSYRKTQQSFIRLAQKYNDIASDYWGITSINHYGIKERNLKCLYEKTVMVDFEGYKLPAPEGYHIYLSQLYGNNYMQLPPAEKRVSTHTFKTYKL